MGLKTDGVGEIGYLGLAMSENAHLLGFYDFYSTGRVLFAGSEEHVVHLCFSVPKKSKDKFIFQFGDEEQPVRIINDLEFRKGSLESPNKEVRTHAVWALALATGPKSEIIAALETALQKEVDPEVKKEISDHLKKIRGEEPQPPAKPTAQYAWRSALPAWIAIPEKELGLEMSVEVGIVDNPGAITLLNISLMFDVRGNIKRQGDRTYRLEEEGCILLWTSADTLADKKDKYTSFPWSRDWLKGQQLKPVHPIEDFSNFALTKKGGGFVRFVDTSVLACLSNVFVFQEGNEKHRFIAVTYDYKPVNPTRLLVPGLGVEKRAYVNQKTVFWPLDKAFLVKVRESENKGSPLYESAHWLIYYIERREKK